MVCAQTCELRSELPGIKCKVGELSSCSGEKRGSSANSSEIKFYNLLDVGARQGDGVILVREPHNPWDSNCVVVFLRGGAMLGHVAKEVAEWLSPMLLGPFCITAWVSK